MIGHTSRTSTRLLNKVQSHRPTPIDKGAIDLVFSVLALFLLTCVGAMVMVCFFFDMEKIEKDQKSHSPLAPSMENRQSSTVLQTSSSFPLEN